MIRVQILNVTVPSIYESPGGVFLDIGETDLSLSRVAEELNEVNQIQYGGVRQFSLPASPKNRFIFREFITPTPHDFDYTPLECRIMVGSNVLEETKIGVSRSSESTDTLEAIATKANDYWLIGAMALRLPQIPYETIELTQANIEDNWANNFEYTDGDIGIHFTPMYFGTPYIKRKMTVEYMRWTYHLIRLYREGFRTFGWCFECEALETDEGRKIAAYLIDPNAYSSEALIEANKATAETGEQNLDRDQKRDGLYIFRRDLNFGTIGYDPGSNMIDGKYQGLGRFKFKLVIQYIPKDMHALGVVVKFWVYNPDGSRFAAHEEAFLASQEGEADDDKVHEQVIEVEIQLQVNQSLGVGIRMDSLYRKLKIQNIFLQVTPLEVYPQRGQTINPAEYLRNDTLLEALKGFVHVMRGKLDVVPGEKTLRLMPNYETDFLDETLEGYYRNTLIDVTPIQVRESSVVETPTSKPNRYQLIRYKKSTDPSIDLLGLDKLTPLHSKTVDLGEQFSPEYTEYENPYFEPTLNDWVYDFSPEGKELVPVNLPMMLDHIPEEGKFKISTNIGPRIILLTTPSGQSFTTEAGVQFCRLGWEDSELSSWNYGYQRNAFLTGDTQKNLVFGDPLLQIQNTLYNVFWRSWVYGNLMSTTIDILAVIKGGEYFGYSFRDAYKVIVRGKGHICNLISINDFAPRSGVSTPLRFQPRGVTGFVSESAADPCDSYSYDLQVTESSGTWNFAITTDNPDDGTIEYRYEGTPTWTEGTSLANPTGPFYVRYTAGGDCGTTVVKYIDPCGNIPTISIDYELDESGNNCVTATITGILNDDITGTDLEYELDESDSWIAYTPGTEICGSYEKICFRGTVEFDNNCSDYEIEEICFDMPPEQDCNQNTPAVEIIHDGLDSFRFDIGGTFDSPIGSFHFFYKHDGEDDSEAKRWTDMNPIVGTDYLVRLHIFWCDDCPPYCSEWVPVVEPAMMLMTPMALSTGPNWDFSKIPEDMKPQIRSLVESGQRAALARVHNDLQLSEYDYCCGADFKKVMNWFRWALDNGKLD